jgi:XTP/dITP diphosphohydrolase
VADASGAIRLQVSGCCRGRILRDLRGRSGFGYDPLFYLPEYHRTFGELSLAVKSVLSHRARAFQRLIPALTAVLARQPS